mmetsp:Transcript_16390/g.33244  ORF Transcript_16390/g.33244 Transcript_16390/m.33244 type:complete len:276 (-) Transcript_16390:110-937(-)
MLGSLARRSLCLARTSGARSKHTLVLIRHGQSVWNLENKFTGWYDVELSEKGHEEAKEAGKLLCDAGFKFDKAYTSVLKRAIRTLWHSLEQIDQMWVPVEKEWRLNERHYGELTGLDKQETVDKHGKEQVLIWRRSFDIPPPPLDEKSEHFPGNDVRYASLPTDVLPKGESLKLTAERVMPLWADKIVPDIKEGKNLIIAAHGNSLRALVKHLDEIPDDEIVELNIPTGVPLVYELDEDMKPIPHKDAIAPLKGYYLGDQEAIRARILGVKNQTK